MSELTPYDTGERLEPQTWVTSTAGLTSSNADDFGKVDFDDDESATIATLHIEQNAPGHPERPYILKFDALNEPLIIHGPGGEYLGTVRPL